MIYLYPPLKVVDNSFHLRKSPPLRRLEAKTFPITIVSSLKTDHL
jgi:hypothetical protein